jgi:hypothetical protein
MDERNVTTEAIQRLIRQRISAIYGEDCAEKNQGEIETLASMVERVRRLDVPAFEPLNANGRR